jgi:hypothetical protein
LDAAINAVGEIYGCGEVTAIDLADCQGLYSFTRRE